MPSRAVRDALSATPEPPVWPSTFTAAFSESITPFPGEANEGNW